MDNPLRARPSHAVQQLPAPSRRRAAATRRANPGFQALGSPLVSVSDSGGGCRRGRRCCVEVEDGGAIGQ